jgi:hypothetical protein
MDCVNNLKALVIASISAIAITGCNSSGGGSPDLPEERPEKIISGNAVDAVITNGIIRAYAWDGGQQGELLGEANINGEGFYSLNIRSEDRPILLVVSDGRYTEEASGVNVEMEEGQVLTAPIYYQQDTNMSVQVNPYTHLATCYARYKINAQGENTQNAITAATSAFSGLAGVDIIGTFPLNVTDPANANFEVTDGLRFGALLAGNSSFTAEKSVENGVDPHRFNQNSSIYFAQVACQDIEADGLLNGLGFINNGGSIGQLALGSETLDTDSYRLELAQHVLNIMSSDRNATGLEVGRFVQFANQYAESTAGMFGNEPPQPVDQEGPVITSSTANGAFLKDIVNLPFQVTDPLGVDNIQVEINGLFHSYAQSANPTVTINTLGYTDGPIEVTIIAEDVLNNTSEQTFTFNVDNTSPTIELTSSRLVNNRTYQATGTYQLQGSPISTVTVNGVPATIDTTGQTWTAQVLLNSGNNDVELVVTDSVGNIGENTEAVDVDLILPAISPNSTNARFTTYQGQYNLCNYGEFTQTSAANNPLCVSTDNISLNGTAIDTGLPNLGYLLIRFGADDPQGAGVFTSRDDLTVEYMYEKGGVEKISWTAVPRVAGSSDLLLPVVTEYLGNDWYQTTTDETHVVTIRVTDLAGNTTTSEWKFRVDVLVPEIVINSSIANESLLTGVTFANRSALDGQNIDVEYTLENQSNTAYFIALDDAEAHSTQHTYTVGVRRNRARLQTTREWRFRFINGVYQLGALTFTEWQAPNNVYDSNGGAIPTRHATYGEYADVNSDNPPAPSNTAWSTKDPHTACQYSMFHQNVSGDMYLGMWSSPPNTSGSNQPVIGASVYLYGVSMYNTCGAQNNWLHNAGATWQERHVYQYVSQSGYPRNEFNDITNTYATQTGDIVVYNDSLGQEILPTSGWYRIPPNTQIRIVKTIRTPILQHYTDSEIVTTPFTSYIDKRHDTSTTWTLDTDLELTRAADPGDVSQIPNVTHYTETIGQGSQAYTVSRI